MIRMMLAVLIRTTLAVLVLAAGAVAHASALQPPEGRKIRVAVVMTEGAVVIDYAGPWEVFENVHIGRGDMDQQMRFELYTVGRDRQPIHTSGGMKPGMTVVPDYGVADAPAPDAVVVGAQSGGDQLSTRSGKSTSSTRSSCRCVPAHSGWLRRGSSTASPPPLI